MNRVLAICNLFLGVTIVAWILAGSSMTKAQQPAPPCGDMNGDSAVDINDAVYLLNNLFTQGPPLACANQPALTPEEILLLQEMLPHLSVEFLPTGLSSQPARTIRLTGVNLQVVNGLGATNGNPEGPHAILGPTAVNGLGNVIVGYNEDLPIKPWSPRRTGSHNIITGIGSEYRSFGGVIAGRENSVSGPYSSVIGGVSNSATEFASTVTGGLGNRATGFG